MAVSILAEIIASRPRAEATTPVVARADRADAVDPVCGMTVATVEASLHAEHDGAKYWFCGPGCHAAFFDRPKHYAQ